MTVTAKLDPGLDLETARADIRALRVWRPAALDPSLLDAAWDLQDGHGFSLWDALIVAAALRLRCEYLLTEDFQDGRAVENLRILSPFVREPQKILPG